MLNRYPDALLELDRLGTIIAANELAAGLLGRPVSALEGLPLREVLGDEGADEVIGGLVAPASGSVVRQYELAARRPDGVPYPLDVRLCTGAGSAVIVLRDRNVDGAASLARRCFDAAFDLSPIGMALMNSDGCYVRVNASLCDMLGYGEAELLGRRDQEFTHPEDRQADVEAAWRILNGELSTWQTDKRFLHASGSVVHVIANLAFLRDERERPVSWVGQFQDVTALREAQERQRMLAEYDDLTGLCNRRRFLYELDREVARAERYGHGGAVLIADLDGFKAINDSFGHLAGDEALRSVAAAMAASLRATDVLARLGGDEFAALLPEAQLADADATADRICRAIDALAIPTGGGASLSVSIGVAAFDVACFAEPGLLLARADVAMYAAKRCSGGGGVSVRSR